MRSKIPKTPVLKIVLLLELGVPRQWRGGGVSSHTALGTHDAQDLGKQLARCPGHQLSKLSDAGQLCG
jgi:hypothetical protein